MEYWLIWMMSNVIVVHQVINVPIDLFTTKLPIIYNTNQKPVYFVLTSIASCASCVKPLVICVNFIRPTRNSLKAFPVISSSNDRTNTKRVDVATTVSKSWNTVDQQIKQLSSLNSIIESTITFFCCKRWTIIHWVHHRCVHCDSTTIQLQCIELCIVWRHIVMDKAFDVMFSIVDKGRHRRADDQNGCHFGQQNILLYAWVGK